MNAPRICPVCGSTNDAPLTHCHGCGLPLISEKTNLQTGKKPFSTRRKVLITLGLALGACVGVGGGIWWRSSLHPSLVYRGHAGIPRAVAWSSDGHSIASSDSSGTIQVWDATTGAMRVSYQSHSLFLNGVCTIAWAPSGTRIASAADSLVQVWDAATGTTILTYRGHNSLVTALSWSPNGQHIASSSDDGTLHLWDATTGEQIWISPTNEHGVADVAWSPEGSRLATSSVLTGLHVVVLNATTGSTIWTHQTPLPDADRVKVTWSASGSQLLTINEKLLVPGNSGDPGIFVGQVLDARTSQAVWTSPTERSSAFQVALPVVGAWISSSKRVIFAVSDSLWVWEMPHGSLLTTYSLFSPAQAGPLAFSPEAFSPDRRRLACSSLDKVQIYDIPESL